VAAKAEGGEVLPGGYHVEKGQAVIVLLHELHRDPAVWGADAEEFRPERFLEGRTYPPDAYKPFGNGARACIGRGFAMQEAVLALALITSRFDIEMADPSYDLEIRQSLTVKPDNFRIVARPRKDRHQSLLAELLVTGQAMSAGPAGKSAPLHPTAGSAAKAGSAGKLYVLYGSNSGSCEGLANEIANEGSARGFAVTLSDLDSMAGGGALPTDGPVVICTASYEGRPTDNARMFVSALESTSNAELAKGVKYCVIGAGHHDWASTFHRVPTLVDRRLAELGGERFMPLHTSDAGGDIVGDFEAFKNDLWEYFVGAGASGATSVATTDAAAAAAAASADKPATPVRVFSRTTNATAGKIGAGIDAVGEVLAQEILVPVTDENPQINSMTVKLPEGQTYRSGDYLAVLARNPAIAVERALKHFGLNHDDRVVLDIPSSYLPSKVPVSASNLLAEYVELGQPVSKRLLPRLAELATDGSEKQAILALDEKYPSEIMAKRVSLLDLLERFPSCKVTFDFFIVNIPKMKIRQYSISSTPLASPSEVTLTFRIHTVPGQGGAISRPAGVASNYLAFLHPGDSVLCSVKASAEFHLPQDPSTPVVMFAAGSGFAPFRGFIHERALQKAAGRTVGPTVLYYGCRDAGDMVHKTELAGWVREGVLDLRPVLSRSTATSIPELQDEAKVTLSPEQRYVQHRVWVERKDVSAFFHAGATFYTCGSGAKLGSDLKKTLVEIIRDEQPDLDAQKVYERLAKDRHKTDVFL
jgi:cytochrome P450/NADPH-cytochrome P450 reductase